MASNYLLVPWAPSFHVSGLLALRTRHGQDQPRHLLRLVQLDEVLSTRDQEEVRTRQVFVERPGDAAVQGRIGVAEDDPDRTPELPQPGYLFRAGPNRRQEVFVQAKEGR